MSNRFISSHEANDALFGIAYKLAKAMLNERFFLPQHNASIVASGSVLATPGKSFLAQTEIFGYGQDGIREATSKSVFVTVAHVLGRIPKETFIKIDVWRGPIANW